MMKMHHSNQVAMWKGLKLIKTNGITLRDYQIDIAYEAAYKLSSLRICYLAMQMRTGKTLTALACASVIYKRNSNVLFVTKKKAISSIESDAKLLVHEFDLTIINYESLHKIPRKQYDLVICDEAHGIGAFPKPSERYSQLKMIMGANTSLLLLSGTPSPESYSQLFHQFKLSSYSPFHATNNFYAFAKEFVNVKKKRINATVEVNDYSDCNWKQLEPVLDKYFIRYNQKSAGFINEISEEVIEVEMKPITYNIAATLKRDKIYEGKNDVILADTPVKLLNKLHQIFSGSVILESEKSVFLDDSKIVYIQENYQGEHIAIFYKFQAEGEQLKKSFKNWTDDPNEFNADHSKIFIAQVQSVKEGVNLSSADTIIFYNIDFSSSTYQQARERASHKDRVKENNVVFLVARGGVERSIYEVVQKKQDYTYRHYEKIFGK
jgi:SNF2 family DNA or RNA helicase